MRRALFMILVLVSGLSGIAPAGSEPLAGASRFVALGPVRVLDTRPVGKVPAGGSIDLQITGTGGVPASGVSAVALNVTATRASGPGFLQVFPTGQATIGASSNLNVEAADQTIPNMVVVPVGNGGKITFYSQGGADVLADVLGYFVLSPAATSAGRYIALTPARTLDTRSGSGLVIANPGDTVNCSGFATWDEANRYFWRYYERYGDVAKLDANNDQIVCESLYASAGSPAPGKPADVFKAAGGAFSQFTVAGAGGVPSSGVAAVVLNVTATDASPGFLSVLPGAGGTPTSSSLNVTASSPTIANLVILPVGSGGTATIFSESPAHLIADVAGYFTDGTAPSSTDGLFVPVRPERLLDTRKAPASKLGPAGSVAFAVRGAAGVPATAVAAFLNVTATEATNPGFVQVLPTAQAVLGSSSNLNITTVGQTIPAAVFATLSTTTGQVTVYTQSGAHALADVAGYFTGGGGGGGGGGGPVFGSVSSAATGTHAHASVVADFNGDGMNDVATANAGSNSVTVRLGNGSGALGAAASFAVGSEPKSVAVGDFNGDNKLDLVTANQSSSNVSVLLGNGNGTFAAAVNFPAAPNTHEVAVGDLNGDANADLATVGWGGSVASVLLGNGNGTFAPKVDYAVGSAPHSVAMADLNGDNKLDLATANHDSDTASVLLGNGNGTFAAKVDYAVGAGPHSIRAGDLTGDGRPDLVVANDSSSNISVLVNTGTGTFAAKVDYSTTATPKSVAIADVNGDGKLDVLVASIAGNYPSVVNAGADRVALFLGNGNGTLGARTDYPAGPGAFAVVVGDLNGDTKPDMVVSTWHDNAIQIRLNQS